MKRHIITCLAILCIMLINACVPTVPQSFNTSQLFYPLMNQGSVTSSPSAPAGLPSTFAEFKSRCNSVARSPEGAVKMYFDAVFCYFDPSRRTEASKMLRYIMHADANWEKKQKYVFL